MSGGAPASPTLSHLPWAGPTDRKALFSPGGSGKAASVDLPPKLVPRSMHVCVSRPQHGRGARGWVALGAAGSAQPVSPRAKQGRPTALRAQGTAGCCARLPWPCLAVGRGASLPLPPKPRPHPSDSSHTHAAHPAWPGPGMASPQPHHPGGRGLLSPPPPRQCWRQLWGASGRKNGEGRLHQKRVIWHRTGTGTGARRPGRPRKAPPDILLSEGPSPALGTGSIFMGGIQARQVQELRVESHPPRGGRCPFRRICTALPAGHVPRRTGQRGLGAPSGRVGGLQRAVLVPEGGEHVSVEIVGPSWGERPALSRAAREAGLQGTCR